MSVKELSAASGLVGPYSRALLDGVRKSEGEVLPELEYVRRNIVVDPQHLAAYNRVCGFRLADEVPATYPHVLAFPLQVALMTEPSFPFPLLGMVHIANRITQQRPVRITEEFTLRVRAQNLRPHEKGMQFDVVSELLPQISENTESDDPVWVDVSTYLRRGGGSSGSRGRARAAEHLARPEPHVVWGVPTETGRRYAEVSGDWNPIHLHRLTARLFGFRSAIAHGMWTKARSLADFEGRLPGAQTIQVWFKQPVLLPTRVGLTSWRTGEADPGRHHVEQADDRGDPTEPTGPGWAFELWGVRKPALHLRGTIAAGHEE